MLLQLVNTVHSFAMPNGLVVFGVVTPKYQCDPGSSDGLCAESTLILPGTWRYGTNKTEGYIDLLHEIEFGGRLRLFDKQLSDTWGYGLIRDGSPYRKMVASYSAATWLEALEAAAEGLLREVRKLHDAITVRLAALHSEGEEYYLARALLPTPEPDNEPVPYGPIPEFPPEDEEE